MYILDNLGVKCTSQGCLDKGFYTDTATGECILVKGNTPGDKGYNQCYEPYSEALASMVADCLGLSHIHYWLAPANDFPEVHCDVPHVSVCKIVTPPEGYQRVTAMELCSLVKKRANSDLWGAYNSLPIDISPTIDMLMFDAIIGNMDRHINNWDFYVRAAEGGLDIRYAEILDNGASLLAMVASRDLSTSIKLGCDKSKPFKDTHDQQLRFLKKKCPQYTTVLDASKIWDELSVRIEEVLNLLPDYRAKCIRIYLHNRLFYYIGLMKGC